MFVAPTAGARGGLVVRVLVCSIVVMAVALGVRQSLGLFLVPMTTAEVLGRQGFSLSIALQNLAWGASGPLAGWLADRHGARPVVAVCAVLLASGIGLMALVPSSQGTVFLAGLLSGVGLTGTTFTVLFGAIARAHAPAEHARAITGVLLFALIVVAR
jgi:MFS family permease